MNDANSAWEVLPQPGQKSQFVIIVNSSLSDDRFAERSLRQDVLKPRQQPVRLDPVRNSIFEQLTQHGAMGKFEVVAIERKHMRLIVESLELPYTNVVQPDRRRGQAAPTS
ncbi:MAG: hypothetical protein Q8N23_06075 [Archangium sp.]|nr:hypothetical protein [Archangium sp.]MDP3152218.1 hypothetical protein [Archangium sp.]MDP3571063.1 hypothetical protein [Archangium sp.]